MNEGATHAVDSASADEDARIIAQRTYVRLAVDYAPWRATSRQVNRGGSQSMDNPRTRLHYPILLSPIALEKVWGGSALARRFPTISRTDSNVGEVWVVWEGLAVKNGDLAGKTLRELFAESPTELVGPVKLGSRGDGFPLLVKFLDARENLSVQVHPDDDYARAREGQPFGKCEMWYVLEAAAGASVIHGLRSDLPIDGVP